MPQYIAFLRAINIGGHTVKMDELRRQFESWGFTGVETFIASGNVIFETEPDSPQQLESLLEGRLLQALGYQAATFIRTPAELTAIAGCRPFPPAQHAGAVAL